MRGVSLHAIPPLAVVARGHMSLLWTSGRVWVLLAACVVPATLIAATASRFWNPLVVRDTEFSLLHAAFWLAPVALMWALLVWKGEGWGARDYHASLPVDRVRNDVLRVVAGGVWLLATVIAALAAVVSLHGADTGRFIDLSPHFWFNVLTAPTLVYLGASVIPLCTRRTLEWSAGIVGGVTLVAALNDIMKLRSLSSIGVQLFQDGDFSLMRAVFGGILREQVRLTWLEAGEPLVNWPAGLNVTWVPAMLFWLAIAVVAVVLALRRRA